MREPSKRVLLMYVHENSGHHHAALALAKAFQMIRPSTRCFLVDSLRYTNPILEPLIRKTYMGIIKKGPGCGSIFTTMLGS